MSLLDTLTVGADPELFVKSGRHFLSGHLFQCGDKYKPMKTEHAWIQNDGIALEINIYPARNQTEFVKNCVNALSDLRKFVQSKDPKADIVARPSIFFGNKKLQELPALARTLGCNPDFTVGRPRPNNKPNENTPFRTGAGHIHVGWTNNQDTDVDSSNQHAILCRKIVKSLDVKLGLPSLLWDRDDRRRTLYGGASCYRIKPYGVEYRTPSNAWLVDEKLMAYVYQQTVKAVLAVEDETDDPRAFDLAQRYINSNNRSWVDDKRVLKMIG